MSVMAKRQQSMRLTSDAYQARSIAMLIFNNDRLSIPLQVCYCAEAPAAHLRGIWAIS